LAKGEPRLAALLADARSADEGGDSFCANAAFHGQGSSRGFKGRISFLVGWSAGVPPMLRDQDDNPQFAAPPAEQRELHHAVPEALRSQEAYELVYTVILNSLPPCRSCACVLEVQHDSAKDAGGE
jgi:hypothetical protein